MNKELNIVMYHYVRSRNNCLFDGFKVRDTGEFENQINYFNKNFNIIDFDILYDFIFNNKKLPDKSCLLTFDDGYLDHFINVFPILNKYKIKALFYPSVVSIQRKSVLEVNKIHILFSELGYKDPLKLIEMIRLEYLNLQKKYSNELISSFEDLYKKYAVSKNYYSKEEGFIKSILQYAIPHQFRQIIINNLFQKVCNKDEVSIAESLYMSKEMISLMYEYGMHIGVHGYSHNWLNFLNKFEQEKEIKQSLDLLNKIKKKVEPWSIAYPFGGYNNDTIEICLKFGCTFGFTTQSQPVMNINNNNRLILPRLDTNYFPF